MWEYSCPNGHIFQSSPIHYEKTLHEATKCKSCDITASGLVSLVTVKLNRKDDVYIFPFNHLNVKLNIIKSFIEFESFTIDQFTNYYLAFAKVQNLLTELLSKIEITPDVFYDIIILEKVRSEKIIATLLAILHHVESNFENKSYSEKDIEKIREYQVELEDFLTLKRLSRKFDRLSESNTHLEFYFKYYFSLQTQLLLYLRGYVDNIEKNLF